MQISYAMETNIINVGNSKGIIIPAKLLKMIGLENIVNVEIEEGKLVISPASKPRSGREEMIKAEVEKSGQGNLFYLIFLKMKIMMIGHGKTI